MILVYHVIWQDHAIKWSYGFVDGTIHGKLPSTTLPSVVVVCIVIVELKYFYCSGWRAHFTCLLFISKAHGMTLHSISRSVLVTYTWVNRKKLFLVHPKNTDKKKRIKKCNWNAFCITRKPSNKSNDSPTIFFPK